MGKSTINEYFQQQIRNPKQVLEGCTIKTKKKTPFFSGSWAIQKKAGQVTPPSQAICCIYIYISYI
jgi:hypothetical protein